MRTRGLSLLIGIVGTWLVGLWTGSASAQTLTTLHTFQWDANTNPLDGSMPLAGVVQGADGRLYGTTEYGGADGGGIVYSIATNGTSFQTLWQFGAAGDGSVPQAGLIQGFDGNFYGTTSGGGTDGSGIIYKITPAGVLTILRSLTGGTQGSYPVAGLVQGSNSNFYGVAYHDGLNGGGTAFKITPAGTLTVLHSFGAGSDGEEPAGALVLAKDGNFYGTTYRGGVDGQGDFFRLSPGGVSANLHSFHGGSNPNGGYPQANLIQGTDGWLYGTTTGGGNSGAGTVFRISTNGAYTTLYSFTGGTDGASPQAGLLQASDGNFYGTTHEGGNGNGTVFMITPAGALTTVYTFTNSGDGQLPSAGLIQDCLGYLYGTTSVASQGVTPLGTVFRLAIPLPTVATPSISPNGGDFAGGPVAVTLSCATPGATIHFTTNGITPTADSPVYTGQFLITDTTTIQAIGTACAYNPSPVASARIVIYVVITGQANPSGAGTITGDGGVERRSNALLCATANPCYTFANWTEGNGVVSSSACYSFVALSNRTLVANFTLQTRIINSAVAPAGAGTVTGGGVVDCGSNVTLCAAANSCYTFANWTEGGNVIGTTPCYSFVANTNRTLTANYTLNNYVISTGSAPSVAGTTSGGGGVACGSNVTVTATPTGCYQFANWTESGIVVSTSASYNFTVAGARTLVANFSAPAVSIHTSVTPPTAGTISGGGTVNCGSNVTLVATPTGCYTFANWTEGSSIVSTAPNYNFTAAGPRTLVANFNAPLVTIATSTRPAIAGTASGGGSLVCGSSVTVTAAPTGCYIFANWTDGDTVVSTSPTYNFTIAGARSLVANFNPAIITIDTSSIPTSSGTISGGGPVACGSNVTLVATPAVGYTFVKWTENSLLAGTQSGYSLIAATNRSLVAVFDRAPIVTGAPAISNALLVVNSHYIVVAGETNLFTVTATDPDSDPLLYQWTFGDGVTNSWSPLAGTTHVYASSNCGPYRASVTVSDGQLSATSNLAAIVACDLIITKLQIGVNFSKVNTDSISLKAKLTLPGLTAVTQLAGVPVVVDVGDVQLPFTLDKKGHGVSANGSVALAFTKATKKAAAYWSATITLSKGTWRVPLAKYGLDAQTHKTPGIPVKIPVVLLVGDEAFAAEPLLHYTSTLNKSGTAK